MSIDSNPASPAGVKQKREILAVIAIFVLILGWMLWGSTASYWAKVFADGGVDSRVGAWGDSFGAFNAFLSALGFVAIWATLYLQNRAMYDQQVDLHKQRFESTFFELMRLMRELRAEVRFRHSAQYALERNSKISVVQRSGDEAITSALMEMRHWTFKLNKGRSGPTREQISEIYMKRVHGRHESRMAPYFRIIYTILNKIRNDMYLSEDEKAYYGNLVRSQLTSHDISLLAFNATSPVSKDLADLLESFHMLKYLPAGVTRRILSGVFADSAFAARD